MNKLDAQYLSLLEDIKENGFWREARNGKALTVLGRTFRHNMRDGFPLLTTKKMWWKGIVGELSFFLSGGRDIRRLWKDGITIWDGDWYKNYSEKVSDPYSLEEIKLKVKVGYHQFPDEMFDMGPIYGYQWRCWRKREWWMNGNRPMVEEKEIDQIKKAVDELKNNPDSRKIRVSAWNVGELDEMLLEPCHYGFTLSTRELTVEEKITYGKERGISLIWSQRSVDTPLGLPFNIASYALLLLMFADEVNMVPLELIGHLEDVHIYENQLEGVEEQLKRSGYSQLPTVHIRDGIWSRGETDIILENYRSDDKIDYPLSN